MLIQLLESLLLLLLFSLGLIFFFVFYLLLFFVFISVSCLWWFVPSVEFLPDVKGIKGMVDILDLQANWQPDVKPCGLRELE